jgi:AmmeMemoRadiSam system protein B
VHGLAASSVDMFATPLGNVRLDKQALAALHELKAVDFHDAAHAPEHALEVHLPFLQRLLGDFTLVPLVVGDASQDDVASVLKVFADDTSTLIVVSSDLSHYLDYDAAVRVDRNTSIRIEALRPLEAGQACGRNAINGLLVLARQRGWTARTVDLRNSGDTAGPHGQVVGYGAYVFLEAAGEGPAGS